MVDIKDIQGNILLSTPISEGSKRKFTLQKEDYIALKFSVDDPIYFKLGDGIDDDNIGLFELVNLYKPTYNESTGGYDYELQLDAYYWKWKNKIFKFTPESGGQEAAWNLTAGLDVHLGIFLRNLKLLSYTYRGIAFEFSIDSTVENSSKLVSYDSTNMIDALTKMAETWECEWWITDNIIHFGRCEFGDPVDFEIDVNVKSMPRSDSQTNYATRIYAFGSTRNIPTNYRPVDENIVVNGVVQKRLMLPVGTPYIDAYEDMSEEEAVEDIVIFDDIYPRRVGTMSDITPHPIPVKDDSGKDTGQTVNVYRFKDLGIMFSKEYILEGGELKIVFQSGSLNGMEFGVIFNPEGKDEKFSNGLWNPEAQLWEIVRSEDYGRFLPDDILKPVTGDTYVLSGFDTSLVSDQYLPAAEQELKEKAQAYVEKTKKDPSTYSCTMSSVYMHNDGESRIFEIGDRVNLINKGYFENGRMSRIIGFEYYLDKPCDSTIYTVGETAAYSRIGEIENKLDSVTYKGQTYTGGSGSGVYVIRTNDNTIASNSNVLSALRSLSTFLRKDSDDEASGLITFLKGLNLGQFVTRATGGHLDAAGNAELNSLIVRLKAEVQSLDVSTHTKTKTLEVLETLSAKLVTSEKVSANEISATLIEAVQIIGDNIIANETVAGKNVTASEKVTGKSLVAKEDISGVTADILDKTTTLNLLVKNLAEIYDLNVSHVATLMGTIVKEYISSESFVSGFAGEGMKIYKALNGDWNMEIDNLTVRKIFSVFELVVQRITHQGGMVIRSAAGGKLTKVTDGGTYWRCEHDSTDDFALNDQIICQAFTGNQAKRYWRLVTSAGAGYFNLSKADCEAGSNNPEAGDEVAVLGNRTNAARQKAQIDCAVGDNAPYRDDYDNINSYSLVGKLITRTGNLSGITDAVFDVLSGSGLYGTNVYLKGTFRLISGKTVEEAISDAQVLAQEYSDNKLTTFKTTTYQSDIQALQESISLKVSSATYQQDQSAVTTRLSAAEAKITDEAIRLTVKSQTETIAKSAVDGIQVGGRNLYLNSEPEKVYDREYTFYDIVEIVKANLGNMLTYSMDVKVPIDGNVDVYSLGNYNIGIYKGFTLVANTWTRISVTGVCRYDEGASSQDFCNLSIYGVYGSGRIPTVRRLKIEHGNKATDWTAAPEDVASDIDKAKDDAIDYVDGIQIGGSNLATGTADFDTVDGNIRPNYQAFGPNASFKFRGNVVKQITALWQGFRLLLEPTLSATIVSFYARVDAGGSASIKTIAGNSPNSFPNGNVINSLEWKQYYIYFPSGTQFSNASSQGIVEFADLVGKVYYSSVKVELGDKPTDWSPAPEDIANQAIKDAAGKYTTKSEFSTSITQLSNQIELKASQVDLNALGGRVFIAETTITQHTNSIALKASQSDLNVLGNRVSAAELKITPDAINLAVKSQTENIAKAAAKRTEVVVDSTGLDVNTYYPVTIGMSVSSLYTITVGRPLDASMGVPPWSTHQGGFSALCKWISNGNGWGTIPVQRIILSFTHAFASYVVPLGSIGQMDFSNNEYIYVRGGSKYNVVVEGAAEVPVTLHSETYLVNGQSISPLTEIVTPIPDLSTKLAKTEFTSELVILNNSIATKVSQITFDQLGNTVSNHTTQLTQLPNTIDARITTQTSEGGIIKDKVESWFTMSGNTISLGAKTINISGATVFNSLATQTQAQGYAGNALDTAKGYTDTLQTTLGSMAFQDQVTLAKLDSTIIDGGFLKTTLIAANSITADKIDVDSIRAAVVTADTIAALRIVTGNIEVTNNALVGGFKVSSYNLANVDNRDCWISVTCNDAYSKRVSSLGNNYPSSTGIATAGYFSATGSSRNHALILNATGSTENTDIWGGKSNLAIWATGGVKWRMNSGDHWCMPGVLGVFEIDGWSLAMQNRWGNGFSSLGISRGSDKAYAITHNIGHTEYTVLAIPFVTNTDGRWIEAIPMYVDKSSTYIKIFFKTGSNDTTLPRYITFVFFGRNGV